MRHLKIVDAPKLNLENRVFCPTTAISILESWTSTVVEGKMLPAAWMKEQEALAIQRWRVCSCAA